MGIGQARRQSNISLPTFSFSLQAEGYVVHSFDSPLGITREVIRHQPDMVIVDVNMPSITGDKVCQLVRAASYGKGVVILLHSSLPEAELSELARRCGADGSIPKSRDPSAADTGCGAIPRAALAAVFIRHDSTRPGPQRSRWPTESDRSKTTMSEITLFRGESHSNILLQNLGTSGLAVQANHHLIVHNGECILLDPGDTRCSSGCLRTLL